MTIGHSLEKEPLLIHIHYKKVHNHYNQFAFQCDTPRNMSTIFRNIAENIEVEIELDLLGPWKVTSYDKSIEEI